MIDNNWILPFRTDYLTAIFKYFPLLASDYFYIIVIALGYWLKPSSLAFKSLGFLVPFSTLLNCLFKNFFQIERPEKSLHLILVNDLLGFPSGDVQVGVVFWGYFITIIRSNILKFIFLPIIGIAISRLYLGVHSIYDITGALVIGITTLYIWSQYIENTLSENSSTLINKKYWILLALTVSLYLIISIGLKYQPMVAISIGALIGYGLSLKWIINQHSYTKTNYLSAIIFLGVIIILSWMFPLIKTNKSIVYFLLILKFSIISISIFYLIPKINLKFIDSIKN